MKNPSAAQTYRRMPPTAQRLATRLAKDFIVLSPYDTGASARGRRPERLVGIGRSRRDRDRLGADLLEQVFDRGVELRVAALEGGVRQVVERRREGDRRAVGRDRGPELR